VSRGGGYDAVVVGGGITGTATAAFLAAAGARVLLVERDGLASGASGANAGVVWHPIDPVMVGLYRETLGLYRELAASSNLFRLGAEPVGLLEVSPSEAAVRAQAAAVGRFQPDLAPIVLDEAGVREAEPHAAPGLWGCLSRLGFPITPAASTYAYAARAEVLGAVVRAGREAVLETRGDLVTGVRVDGEAISAGAVIAAAGPWTPALLDPTGAWAPIRALWGVVVEVEMSTPIRHIVDEIDETTAAGTIAAATGGDRHGHGEPGGRGPGVREVPSPHLVGTSIIPSPGIVTIGATHLDTEPDPAAWIEAILVRASGIVPALADAPIRGVRACARPLSRDGRPLLGAVPGRRNLFVCAGHGAWGISTGPASARLVADLVLGRAPVIPAELDPGRFGTPGA
jgi:glycine/D-amino acid oxidase-like deaminating enzyme